MHRSPYDGDGSSDGGLSLVQGRQHGTSELVSGGGGATSLSHPPTSSYGYGYYPQYSPSEVGGTLNPKQ